MFNLFKYYFKKTLTFHFVFDNLIVNTNARVARKGRNPQTGAEIKIPAAKAPVFKAGKALKDVVNK